MNEILKTILNQMGGLARIRIMTGAKVLFDNERNLLQFNIGKVAAGYAKIFEVAYDMGRDLYNVKTYNKKNNVMEELKGVYCDELINLFEEKTGYYLF